jgi:hypothetical protein
MIHLDAFHALEDVMLIPFLRGVQLRMLREEDEEAYGEDEEAYGEDEEAYGEDEEAYGEDEVAYHERESRMDQEALQRLTEMGFTEDDILSGERSRTIQGLGFKRLTATTIETWVSQLGLMNCSRFEI